MKADEGRAFSALLLFLPRRVSALATRRGIIEGVARLEDGRMLIIEYKGGDRFSNDDSEEKRSIGDLWAKRSGGRGVYLMAQKVDEQGRNIRDQILLAVNSSPR